MRLRDDFGRDTEALLARRVGSRCSKPNCRRSTRGPKDDPLGSVSIGVAGHIYAASPGGPRYDASLTPAERARPRERHLALPELREARRQR
jgi:hypothetical protein